MKTLLVLLTHLTAHILVAPSAQAITIVAEDSFETTNAPTTIDEQRWEWA